MAVITRAYSEVSGQIAYASSVNRVVDDLYTLQAGNINSANIANSGVGANNFENSCVITRALNDGVLSADATGRGKMADDFINDSKILSQTITYDNIGYEVILSKEVFG